MNLNGNSGVSVKARRQVAQILNHALADEFALSAAARDYHWNVTGPYCRNLNEIFDEQYHQIDQWIEKIGARARLIGITARTGWSELIKAPRFTPARGAGLSAPAMMAELIELHDCMARQLRVDAAVCAMKSGDAGTADFLNELIEYHETASWMLGELREDRELARA